MSGSAPNVEAGKIASAGEIAHASQAGGDARSSELSDADLATVAGGAGTQKGSYGRVSLSLDKVPKVRGEL